MHRRYGDDSNIPVECLECGATSPENIAAESPVSNEVKVTAML